MDPMENLCTICGAIFSSVLGRIKHEKASHSLIELKCNECKYVALGKKNLNNHIQIHKESCCDFCRKTFKTSALVKHKAICISNPEVIILRCDQCPFETKRKDNLKRHMHGHNEKPLKVKIDKVHVSQVKLAKLPECDVCQKS